MTEERKKRRLEIFEKFRRCVRKIYNAMKFYKLSASFGKLYCHPDLLKKKYFMQLEEFIMTAEHGLYLN
jgi:hypothetical protein